MEPNMLFESEDSDMYGYPGNELGDGNGLSLNTIGIRMMERNGLSAAYVDEGVDA